MSENPQKSPSFLYDKGLELIFFGGKGGVGKTTSAAAAALQTADQGRRTLLMSINPAHSLSDIFEREICDKLTGVEDGLDAIELDAKELLEEYKKRYERPIKTIIGRGSWTDAEDVERFWDLSIPGVNEVMAMLKLRDLMKESRYDLYIVDAAATGHMLRFLSLPELLKLYINDILGKMQEKYKYIRSTFTRRRFKDEMDKFLDDQIKDTEYMISLLSSTGTEFVPVTIPESMGVEETKLLLEGVQTHQINVNNLILNLVNQSKECDFCSSRVKDQEKYVEQIRDMFSDYNVIEVPQFPREVRGLENLRKFGEVLAGNPFEYEPSEVTLKKEKPKEKPNIKDLEKRSLILFGGKGGLGKTTVAASAALRLAKELPKEKILIFSTDPAQALGRSFGLSVGEEPTQIKKNLYVAAFDPDKALAEFKEKYSEEIDEVFNSMGGRRGGFDLPFERDLMDALDDAAPPGLDELMALVRILDLLKEARYDIFILDTAPSGHLLRLLELPEMAIDWLSSLIQIQLKYRRAISLVKTMRFCLEKKRDLRELIELLKDGKRTEFVVVTIPEEMGVAETERITSRLRELGISTEKIIINKVTPFTSGCSFCALKREEEQKHIREINEKFSDFGIYEAPLFPHEIQGVDSLTDFAGEVYES